MRAAILAVLVYWATAIGLMFLWWAELGALAILAGMFVSWLGLLIGLLLGCWIYDRYFKKDSK